MPFFIVIYYNVKKNIKREKNDPFLPPYSPHSPFLIVYIHFFKVFYYIFCIIDCILQKPKWKMPTHTQKRGGQEGRFTEKIDKNLQKSK